MCIACIVSYVSKDGHRIVHVLNNRDCDLTTKCLGAVSLAELLKKYDVPVKENEKAVYGLFNDNKYASCQLAITRTRGAVLVDERLHETDPRRAVKTWGRERAGFCVAFASGTDTPRDFCQRCSVMENQHPHALVCWDIEHGLATYRTDEPAVVFTPWTPDQTEQAPFIYVVQTCGSAPNHRRARIIEAARMMCCGTSTFADGLGVLQDVSTPTEGAPLLPLGKTEAYERHVESLRIPYAESLTRHGELMQWATRTSAVVCMSSERSVPCIFESLHHLIPDSVSAIKTAGSEHVLLYVA
jgi:hypothetical protein